jgi:hypothetical protein
MGPWGVVRSETRGGDQNIGGHFFADTPIKNCRRSHKPGGPQMNLSYRDLEEGVFEIDIEVSQQGVGNQRVVAGRKVVLLCIGERRTGVE